MAENRVVQFGGSNSLFSAKEDPNNGSPSTGVPVIMKVSDEDLLDLLRNTKTNSGNFKISAEESDPDYWKNYFSEIALGNITGRSTVNKFGAAPNGIQTTPTDVWSRADATPTQQIWLAPTAARVHAIASTNAGDNGAVIRVYGLPTWDTKETSQDITIPGNTTSLVIVHRMKLLTTVAHPVLLGTVTATAAVNGTVTAVILPADGQTEMAIYGVPSVQKALLHMWYAQIDKTTGVVAACDFELRVNENPNIQTTGFLRKADISVESDGVNSKDRRHELPLKFDGPCIIKIQGISSVADLDGEAGFDLELVDI